MAPLLHRAAIKTERRASLTAADLTVADRNDSFTAVSLRIRLAFLKYRKFYLSCCDCFFVCRARTCYGALSNRAGHYIFILWFLSIFYLFSSPNLSGRRVDVYHTSTHDVALLRI